MRTNSRMGLGQMGNMADLAEGIRQGKIAHILLPEGVSYPIPLKDSVFAKVEELNGISLSIFLIGSKKDEFFPYYASRRMQEGRPHVRLGLLQAQLPDVHRLPNGEASVVGTLQGENRNNHFVLVMNLPGLLGSVSSARRRQKGRVIEPGAPWHEEETLYCDNCLNRFSKVRGSQGFLDHQDACLHNKPTKFVLSQGDKRHLRFNKFQCMETHPFVIYADLEAVNTPVAQNVSSKGSTTVLSEHKVSAWAYQIIVAPKYRHLFEGEPGFMRKPFSVV